MKTKVFLTFLLLASSWAAGAQPDGLGRLFFTPEQRAALDRQRELGSGSGKAESQTYTIDGIVRRSSGHRTTWINGSPVQEDEARPEVAAIGRAGLKVGETLIPAGNERQDLLRGGRIVVRRPPASEDGRQ